MKANLENYIKLKEEKRELLIDKANAFIYGLTSLIILITISAITTSMLVIPSMISQGTIIGVTYLFIIIGVISTIIYSINLLSQSNNMLKDNRLELVNKKLEKIKKE